MTRRLALRLALIAYGAVNAATYASLLPLWEGFDEPFHYAYVQDLSAGRGFPVMLQSPLSGETWESLKLAPGTESVKRGLNLPLTFDDYFLLSDARRAELRNHLARISKQTPPDGLNYEAQQTPLAYVLLAPFDRLWQNANLPTRVWRLRLVCGIFASVATALLLFRLTARLGLPDEFQAALVFLVLSTQMFYATTAHIANDWLAVPVMLWLFDSLVALDAAPGLKNALLVGIALAAGLLTKAYFLAMIPLAVGVVLLLSVRRRLEPRVAALCLGIPVLLSSPWYIRNSLLYHSFTGMQQVRSGVTLRDVLRGALHLPWLQSLQDLAYQSLWTGNNTFRTFSLHTLTLLLAGFVAAAALYVAASLRRTPSSAERLLLAGCLLYVLAIAYDTALVYVSDHVLTAAPWYVQAIAPVALSLLFCGLARSSFYGRAVVICLICLSAYIMTMTWWAKLIPLYAGYDGRSAPLQLIAWYRADFGRVLRVLGATAIADPMLIMTLAAIATISAIALALLIAARTFPGKATPPAEPAPVPEPNFPASQYRSTHPPTP